MQKRRNKAAACAIHVDGNVEAGLSLQAIESGAQRDDVLIVAGKGAAEDADHADGVLVAGGRGAFRVGDHLAAFERHLPRLHIPIAGKLVPADLCIRAHYEVRLVGGHAQLLHSFAPAPFEGQAA